MNLAKLYGSRRPSNLHEICRVVESVLNDGQQSRNLLETKGGDAQIWLDTFQVLAELPEVASKLRSSILKMMLHLSKRSGLCPHCLMIKNVKRLGDFPVGGGGFGDVWMGKIGGQTVCLKVVKVYLVSDVQQLLKEYMREAIVWQQLKHPNLLPFMGMYYLDKAREQLCLVSPWMERGNLVRFLKETHGEDIDHYSLVYDVASGLLHLHSMKIVHGDLKGVNILITPDERACIGDFGLSRVADTHALRLTSSTNIHSKGTTRWLSPELLRSDPPCTSSTSSDIYAFACVCYEIFMGNVPFYELTEGAVIVAVLLDKKHPSRPRLTPLNDQMWNIMVSCWKTEPQLRPTASEVFALVGGLESSKTGSNIKPASAWDTINLTQLWKNVKHPLLDTTTLMRLQKKLSRPSSVTSATIPVPVSAAAPAPALRVMQLKADFDTAQKIAEGLDETRRQAELDFIYLDLKIRVADWQGSQFHDFGQLLLHDTLVYTSLNFSHEYHTFLFENIVLFCWDPTPSRYHFAANGNIVPELGPGQRPITIQGRTDLMAIAKVEMTEIVGGYSGRYLLNIWWKEGDHAGDYSLQFPRQNQMREWNSVINKLIYRSGIEPGLQYSSYPSPPTTPSPVPEPKTVSLNDASISSWVVDSDSDRKSLDDSPPLSPLPDSASSIQTPETTPETENARTTDSRGSVISHSDSSSKVNNKPTAPSKTFGVKMDILREFLFDSPPFSPLPDSASSIQMPETENARTTDSRASVISHSDSSSKVNNKPTAPSKTLKVKVHFLREVLFILDVPPSISYAELAWMVCRRIRLCGVDRNVVVINWENGKQSGQLVPLKTDADVRMALVEQYEEGKMPTLHVS